MTGARLWSRGRTLARADAVAVRDGRIDAVGPAAELLARRGPHTRIEDARGATLTPGLCDAHLHLLHWSRSRAELDLAGADDPSEVVRRVREWVAAHPDATRVVGRGWPMGARFERVERGALDEAAGARPVLLYSRDFHNLWVNTAALRAAGITRDTSDPPGGTIVRDASGEATGLLAEHAMKLMAPLERDAPGDDALLRDAIAALHAFGITAVHDFEGAEAHRRLRALAEERRLRTLMHLPHAQLDAAIETGLASGLGDDWFRVGAVKLFADGTLGSRTAALLEPYEGTSDRGRDLMPAAELAETVRRACAHGWSVAVHAIGDRAVRATLDAFESARDVAPPPLPLRIEHVQLLDPADAPRFAALGVAASMQPSHCVSDIPLAERHWGPRRVNSYTWKRLLELGVLMAFGSDAPVEPPSVALGLYAAVARRAPGMPSAWVPEQAIDLDAALSAYTEGPARLSGTWPRTGTLDPGAEADVVLWDRDLHSAGDELAIARPRMTVLGGAIVHEDRTAGAVSARAATEVTR